ncbi:ATP-grasp domain-containing protein [Pararhizobium sp. DWP1-1-3]|uniref:ATP-grasp domain-containing protein n=1 Tax=Pararhizobium sp. DWP1-1-3 TaxID=2804652 RepID=UPI003CEC4C0A
MKDMTVFRILVTSAGTSTAIGLIKALSHRHEFEIFTTDINPTYLLPLAAFPVSAHTVVPFATDKERYLGAMMRVIEANQIDFVYPVHDEEIRVVAAAQRRGALGVACPEFAIEKLDLCTDKLSLGKICAKNGIRSPNTADWKSFRADPVYPIFVKPRRGVGSRGARLLGNPSDLTENDAEADLVFQDLCEGPEVTVDVLKTSIGLIAIARERLEVKAGVSTKCRVWFSQELAEIANKIADAFELDGLFCFQAMKQSGEWSVTDINPRTGGATAMTTAAGINLYEEYFLRAAGNKDDTRFLKLLSKSVNMPECFVIRYYQEQVFVGG